MIETILGIIGIIVIIVLSVACIIGCYRADRAEREAANDLPEPIEIHPGVYQVGKLVIPADDPMMAQTLYLAMTSGRVVMGSRKEDGTTDITICGKQDAPDIKFPSAFAQKVADIYREEQT